MSKNPRKTTKKTATKNTIVEPGQPSLKLSVNGPSETIENIQTKLQQLLELGSGSESTNDVITSEKAVLTYNDVSSSMNILTHTGPPNKDLFEFTNTGETKNGCDFQDNGGKKRGRKPRGGKLILRANENQQSMTPVSNIILHLKCSMNDLNEYNTQLSRMMIDPLEYNPDVPPEVLTYNNMPTQGFTAFDDTHINESSVQPLQSCKTCKCGLVNASDSISEISSQFNVDYLHDTTNIKDINAKLKMLKVQLYKNAIQLDKKAACFWCTYDFDNTSCHIPKYEMDETIYGYGSFCRPECAVAYLMKENIDDSTKFERYQLLNQIYSKVYGCKKNIKPAPNPYYLLDKYYGNLTIQEYRKLLKTEHLLLVIDKPLTRILPELHEDNEDMIMNIYGINKSTDAVSGVYKVKRQSEKQQGPSKSSIIRNKFGLA